MTATLHKFPELKLRAACASCGIEATCDCNAPYLPAGERAAAAIAANPEKSDRAIAAEIGVSDKTVAAARKATAEHSAVGEPIKRRGVDGVVRKMPKAKRAPDISAGEIHEAARGFKAMMLKAAKEEDMRVAHKRRTCAFAHFKFLIVQNRLPALMRMSADEIIDLLRTL